MKSQTRPVFAGIVIRVLGFGLALFLLAFASRAQNYVYGQAGLSTGNKPGGFAVADFNGDGRLDVAVANAGDNTVSVFLCKADGSYAPKKDYPVGKSPLQVVAADFNGDGKLDLAVANSADNTVSILLGAGDGTFQSQTSFATGMTPSAIAAADFNGDKHVDLAITNQVDGTVSILLGNGDGTFIKQTPDIAIGPTPFAIVSCDMNNDGKPDLLVLSGTFNSAASLSLLTNNGTGMFSEALLLNGALGAMAVGDINHDGNQDIAVTVYNTDRIEILLGNGSGTFQTLSLSVTSSLGAPAQGIALGDFNHDGNMDLAVYEYYFVAIYPGNGDGTFQSPLLGGFPGIASAPPILAVADFNDDGLLDLVATIPDFNEVVILLGNGDGTLGNRADVTLPSSGGIAGAVAADFNGDGKQDLVVAQFNQTTSIQGFLTTLLGKGDGTFQNPNPGPLGDIGINGVVVGDFNGDGNADIATASVDGDGGLAVALGTGNGMFGSPIASFTGLTGLNLGPMVAADFNRDGKSDLLVVSEDDATTNASPMYMLLSQRDGAFKENFIFNLPYGFVPGIATADFNHDGYLDLAASTDGQVLVFMGHGDGTFAAPTSYTTNNGFTNSVVVGDFNGDGKIDIVAGTSGAILFFAGNGDGTFRAPISTPNLTNGIGLITGDFNGDGILDLIVDGPVLATSIMLGVGDGTFLGPSPFEGTYYPRTFATGDFNADGTMDLVEFSSATTPSAGPQTASVWHSAPAISFSSSGLQFADQAVGTSSSSKVISLSNVGNAPLAIMSIAAKGDFSETNDCPSKLKVGQQCAISVSFSPTANGARSGGITVTDNVSQGNQTLILLGSTGSPDFRLSATPNSATVAPGNSTTYLLTVSPVDGFNGTVHLACSGAPSEASCTPSSDITPDGVSDAVMRVTLTTKAPSLAAFPHFDMPGDLHATLVPANMILCVGFFGLLSVLTRTGRWHGIRFQIMLIVIAFVGIGLSGCGGGGSSGIVPPPGSDPGTPTGTYTLTLSASSGSVKHATTITLVVN